MANLDRVRRNIAKLQSKGRDEAYINQYLQTEGVDPSSLGGDDQPKKFNTDPRIEKLMKGVSDFPKEVLMKSTGVGRMLGATEAMTGGHSEDLLPAVAGTAAGLSAAASGVGAPWVVAASGAASGLGEAARQGIRKLRGNNLVANFSPGAKELSLNVDKNYTKDVLKETAFGAAGEGVGQAVPIAAKALSTTPIGKSTVAMFGRAMTKLAGYGARGQQAISDVLNFMGDLHPKSVEYAIKRGPSNLFRPENFDDAVIGKTAGDVVQRMEQMRTGANQAFNATLKNVYRKEYTTKYPFKIPTAKGLEKISNEMRLYPSRIVDAGEKAMRDFGYTSSFNKLKPTVLGELGSKLDEGERLNSILDKVRSFKKMTPNDAITLRQEMDDIIYDGWKDPRTRTSIGRASGAAESVLKSMRRELSNRLHTRLGSQFRLTDEAYSKTMQTLNRARPMFEDTIKAEKTMRKYNAISKGMDSFTQGEKEIIDEVDSLIPHKTKIVDHLFAKEFEPIVTNFWRSRALQGLAIGSGGFLLGGPAGAAAAGVGALAASSPRVIGGTLKASEKIAKGAGALAAGTKNVVKKATPALIRAGSVQKLREEKNNAEREQPSGEAEAATSHDEMAKELKLREGFKPKPYQRKGESHKTIGYGHYLDNEEKYNKISKELGIKNKYNLTEKEAEKLLNYDVNEKVNEIYSEYPKADPDLLDDMATVRFQFSPQMFRKHFGKAIETGDKESLKKELLRLGEVFKKRGDGGVLTRWKQVVNKLSKEA